MQHSNHSSGVHLNGDTNLTFNQTEDLSKKHLRIVESETSHDLFNQLNTDALKLQDKESMNTGINIKTLMRAHFYLSQANKITDQNEQQMEMAETEININHLNILRLRGSIDKEQKSIAKKNEIMEHEELIIQEHKENIAGYQEGIHMLDKEIHMLKEEKKALQVQLTRATSLEQAEAIAEKITSIDKAIEKKNEEKEVLWAKIENEFMAIEKSYKIVQEQLKEIAIHMQNISEYEKQIDQYKTKISGMEKKITELKKDNTRLIKENKEHLLSTQEQSEEIYQEYEKTIHLQASPQERQVHKQHEIINKTIKLEAEDLRQGKLESIHLEHFILANILTQSIITQHHTEKQIGTVDHYLQESKLAA